MARTKQTARKSNKGLLKATKGKQGGKGRRGGGDGVSSGRSAGSSSGVSSGGSGGGIGGGGGAVDGSDRNRNAKGKVPSGCFSQQLENRPPAAAPKCKKPYIMLSRKRGNYSILQNYVYRNIRLQGRSF